MSDRDERIAAIKRAQRIERIKAARKEESSPSAP